MKNKKLLLIIIPVAIIFMASIVFLALWLAQGRPDYKTAASHVGEILQHETTITDHINNTSAFTYDQIDRTALTSFQNSTASISSYFESLLASTAMNDQEVSRRYNEITPLISKLTEISTGETLLLAYIDQVSTSGYATAATELGALATSSTPFLATLGTELSEYYATLAAFEEKYQSQKADDYNTMIEEYGNFILEGEALSAKYSTATIEDVFDISPSAISDYFTKLKELESYLKEKS